MGVYFHETSDGQYDPRAVLVDLDLGVINAVRSGDYRNFFRHDGMISGHYGTGYNWVHGHFIEGAELVDHVLDVVRREAERSDCLQGFQLSHSLGGGTGAGMGSLLLDMTREEYPDRMMAAFSVLPSSKVSESVIEPYNATLSMHHLIESCDKTFIFDNEALLDICNRTFKLSSPSYDHMNQLVSRVMSDITTSFRFPGQLNSDLRKMAANLVPFPRLHFFTVGYAPLPGVDLGAETIHHLAAQNLTQQIFDIKNQMVACDLRNARFLSNSAIFRGQVSMEKVEDEIRNVGSLNSEFSMDWIPNNIQASYCSVAPKGQDLSSTLIANSTAIQHTLKRIDEQFDYMFRRKHYIRTYTMQGMDEMEFVEAQSNMNDLISEYQQSSDDAAANDSNLYSS
ncbi:tubulin-domain-containing protein [Xylaria venustula]|nr:tubulin-domain-containing protein [Xylaria venustula]